MASNGRARKPKDAGVEEKYESKFHPASVPSRSSQNFSTRIAPYIYTYMCVYVYISANVREMCKGIKKIYNR